MSEAYKQAGVDIDAGNETVERIRAHVKRTYRPEVLGDIGGFGGAFALGKYENPVLVSATDGVGTKLKLAFATDLHDSIGIDCVAMCVNDLVVQGAEPLFFLDYLATGKLQPAQAEAVVKGIADGCVDAGCSLIGGETAEMPGMYAKGEYDIAGFCVGVVERDQLIDGSAIEPGDVLIGLASNGLHSNGFSLARHVLFADGMNLELAKELLTPTKIYVKTLLTLMREFTIKGAAHITGGGLVENVPRMLAEGLTAEIDADTWDVPEIFGRIQHFGNVSDEDMFRTFNMGIGMVICVPKEQAAEVMIRASELGETVDRIGEIVSGTEKFRWKGEKSE
ncbi:phosphoribosylformylglycinamidine cyclo-ligase [Shimazuella sp. AN120528]|uniref:phosphoribosylformylglycinamidine cyclo-ligase n=1 Tax=Shimazuella soli TaxID=1892854 RepID=UPI001F0E1FA9|nr:phosphoribosylformylglycinamidine cyclo-ligase [Shimazuella soli]MCH5586603.1 phosphoribosylformylglycinamidine cyclo-ligase [Shimazuella soli]